MSAIVALLERLTEIAEADLDHIEAWCRRCRHRRFRPVAGRFAGMFTINPTTGETIVAAQLLVLNQPFTCPLTFTDVAGATGPGPIGAVTASDPSVSVSLSADGQSCNVTMTATLPAAATLTWTDPAGVVASATVDVTDQPAAFQPVASSFGTFVPGTTG